jgi:hypothetical protein
MTLLAEAEAQLPLAVADEARRQGDASAAA